MDFHKLKHAVTSQFDKMNKHDLFRSTVEKDDLWATYLASFPAGTNPVFRERTEHDCSCCRSFVRTIGDVVAIIDGKVQTIWDVTCHEPAYQAVADAMSALVKSKAIDNVFLHTEQSVGTDKNYEDDAGKVKTWDHFFLKIPFRSNTGKNFVCRGAEIGPRMSESRALHDVLLRSLTELTDDAVDTTLELIAQNSIYRGDEHKFAVNEFNKLKKQFNKLAPAARDTFVWSKISATPASVSKIRNTSIGTLLTELSEGMDLDQAVRRFEAMVAPQNYKRPTAIVTKKQVEAAKEAIEALGLTSALTRRYAHLADISVNDILFADRDSKQLMKDDVFSTLATKTTTPKNLDKVEEVSIEKFINDIVPRAESIEVMFENKHNSNLVSLIAPADPAAKSMFKWDNKFSWSYNGDVADSLKEKVKKAGGNVTGDLCCRLAWYNFDDLDFHMIEPDKNEISFCNKGPSASGGRLDVDMNAGSGMTREPVENIFYSSRNKMKEGVYKLFVHNYSKRESSNVGFEVEFDFMGDVKRYTYEKAVTSGQRVYVVQFKYSAKNGIEIIESLPSTQASRQVWNINTQDFQKVNALMLSPNYWGDHGVGNKHYFFMLDGCQNDGQARGFFNEFLKEELTPHRKVIELVGSKMKTDESVNQLSGLGFSSTQRNELLVRVKGSFTRTVKVMI